MSNVIFDFDGTMADSFSLVVEMMHRLTKQKETLPPEEIERLRGMHVLQICRELHIRPWKIPYLVAVGRRQMRRHMENVHIFEGMPKVFTQLTAQGHTLYITSSNSAANIRYFLKRYALSDEFAKVYGNVGVLGKAKILRRVIAKNNLDVADTFYVGDEVRDILGAKHAGLKMISVTWGYNSKAILEDHHPDYLVNTPAELAAIFKRQ